ncbi:sulfotransferase [Paenibacillus oenotherae]|uniref:Sulfotransferase n=1 Tax=Paenibacillus oenotherae TaxID=1435645 RepID=A0ABS7D9W0_9BACL|nr:sulfotransferase [Paenibacillus oenotherae]MBW7476734.1 sulfotransferase [Paenibacillus oenotherae]
MIDSNGNNLIFLLSTPRSGSSLATVMLQNHSKLFATQEMWFLMSLYDLQFPSHRAYGGGGIIKQFFNGILPEETFKQASRSFALQVYNGLLSSSGADMVIDKSPRYYYLLEFIDALFPQAKRIWLIRNPLSVIASYKKVNQHVNDRFNLKEDLAHPNFNIKMTDVTVGLFRYFSYFSGESPYIHRLHYEEMVAKPREEMQRLSAFLGISYEEGMEKYGNYMNSPKSDLYFSMGVGDPFVGQHEEAHQESINSWKETLDKEEIELYCRTLGARIFHELGYSEQLAEAERITGAQFGLEPDKELLELRTKQLAELTGCKWTAQYQLQAGEAAVSGTSQPAAEMEACRGGATTAEVLQLQITLRALENRLDKSYAEQKRLRSRLEAKTAKINRIKSLVPFGNRLSQLASAYLTGGKK